MVSVPSCPMCNARDAIPPNVAGWRWYCLQCNTVYRGGQGEWNANRGRRDLWRRIYGGAGVQQEELV